MIDGPPQERVRTADPLPSQTKLPNVGKQSQSGEASGGGFPTRIAYVLCKNRPSGTELLAFVFKFIRQNVLFGCLLSFCCIRLSTSASGKALQGHQDPPWPTVKLVQVFMGRFPLVPPPPPPLSPCGSGTWPRRVPQLWCYDPLTSTSVSSPKGSFSLPLPSIHNREFLTKSRG